MALKIALEAEAVKNNSEITREYEISQSRVYHWRRDRVSLLQWKTKNVRKKDDVLLYAQVS